MITADGASATTPRDPGLDERGAIVARGVARYAAARRTRVEPFLERNFSMVGALALHRAALGRDLARAPINGLATAPQVGLKLAAGALRLGRPNPTGRRARLADRLGRIDLLLETDVGRELEWRLFTELLELPIEQKRARPPRIATRDALAEAILADPSIQAAFADAAALIGPRAADPAFRARLDGLIGAYVADRAAVGDIANGLLSLGAGAALVGRFTPGVVTLGQALSTLLAQKIAISSFPLGATLGGLWLGWFPAAPGLALTGGVTGGLLLGAGLVGAFAGVIADPLQRRLGLHGRRLARLIDGLEAGLGGADPAGAAIRDLYVARLFDILDLLRGLRGLVHMRP